MCDSPENFPKSIQTKFQESEQKHLYYLNKVKDTSIFQIFSISSFMLKILTDS